MKRIVLRTPVWMDGLFILKIIAIFGFSILFLSNYLGFKYEQQHVYLADSFLHGKTYFLEVPGLNFNDASFFNGRWYWPLGVFPGVLLTPFVLIFGVGFQQGYISFMLSILTALFLYKIALYYTNNKRLSIFLTLTYVFGSTYYFVAFCTFSWYFSHVVATVLMVSSIYFLKVKDRPGLSMILFMCAFLTRMSIMLGLPFFVLHFLSGKNKSPLFTFKNYIVPIILGVFVFFIYNFIRFGSFLETGYAFQSISHYQKLLSSRDLGMWSLEHVPSNIYILLFKGLEARYMENSLTVEYIFPEKTGLSFIYTSPIFLFIFFSDLKRKINKESLAGTIPILIFLLGSFGLGVNQYGYRFMLDFQPFLFLMLCDYFRDKKISLRLHTFLLFSFIFNTVMIFRFFVGHSILP